MAIDEALLELSSGGNGDPILRLYTFSEPSVTVGYFQRVSPENYPGREKVRRITGGGIVLHGCDLTIALVISPKGFGLEGRDEVYRLFSRSLLRGFGESISQLGVKEEGDLKVEGNYECIREPVASDLIWGGRKLAGCAGRRRRGNFLLHGSLRVYCGEDDDACSLEEFLEEEPEIDEVAQRVALGFAQVCGLEIGESGMSENERRVALHLEEKYKDPRWNFRR